MNKKHALIVGDGWVANARHKPAFKKLNISYDATDTNSNSKVFPTHNVYDFALISTPPKERLRAFEKVLSLGVTTVFFEKPLAHCIEDANKIASLVKQHNIAARSCHNFLFSNVGRAILGDSGYTNAVFYQLNRSDRVLPKWIKSLPFGIGLDEFPHMGYLSRAMFPEDGLQNSALHYLEDAKSSCNKWCITYCSAKGFVYCDLWRDTVYISKPVAQADYWQYKEEFFECTQRIKSLVKKVYSRAIKRKGHDFGTLLMWKRFTRSSLNNEEARLTSIELSTQILHDYLSMQYTRKGRDDSLPCK